MGAPHESNRNYAMAKRHLDLLNRRYNALAKGASLFFSIVPTNIFGPHDNFHLEHSHVVPGLIHRAYLATHGRGEPAAEAHRRVTSGPSDTVRHLSVCGSGKPLRQFIYGRDLARLVLWLLDEFSDSQEPLIIVCPPPPNGDEKGEKGEKGAQEFSIGDVAELICRIFGERFGLELRCQFDTSKSDGQFRKTASSKKLRALHPTFSFTPLECALRETIDWFCAHYPEVRGARGTSSSHGNSPR